MSVTAGEIIRGALATLGASAAGESITNDEASDALRWLNAIVDRWGTQRLTMTTQLRTVKVLANGTASYTIGSGGSINIVRPQAIDNAMLIIDNTASTQTEIPIAVFTRDEWDAIPQKSLSDALARGIYYDHGWAAGLGTIYPWPVPNVATTSLVLYTTVALTSFADQTTSYNLPPGLQEALESHLALRLALPYGVSVSPDLRELADGALADYKRSNLADTLNEMTVDSALVGRVGVYDINSDS